MSACQFCGRNPRRLICIELFGSTNPFEVSSADQNSLSADQNSLAARQRAEREARQRAEREARQRAEREARQRAEPIGRANALSEELIKAAELWQAAKEEHGADFPAWSYGEAPPDIDKMENADALEAIVDRLAKRVAKAQREYAQQSALFRMRTSLQAFSKSQAAASRTAASSAEKEKAQREERELRRCAEEVSRTLETLAAEVSPQDRKAIEQRAQETVESSQASRRRALLVQLRLDIQRANKAGQARQRKVQQVEHWRERLLGLEGPEVEQLDQALRQVVDGEEPLPPDMAQKVEDVVERATEAPTRDHALGVITEELENLGYVVEVGFETASAQGSEMLLRKPDMEEYHVSLQVEAGVPLLHTRVVRDSSDSSDSSERSAERERTDEQMERIWCQDLATALAAAEHREVRGRAVSRNPPGEVPVPTIAPLKSESKPERKRKRKRTGRLKSRAGR